MVCHPLNLLTLQLPSALSDPGMGLPKNKLYKSVPVEHSQPGSENVGICRRQQNIVGYDARIFSADYAYTDNETDQTKRIHFQQILGAIWSHNIS